MKKLFLPIFLLIISLSGALAQNANISRLFTTNEDKGDDMYENLYFERAAEYYLLALKKG